MLPWWFLQKRPGDFPAGVLLGMLLHIVLGVALLDDPGRPLVSNLWQDQRLLAQEGGALEDPCVAGVGAGCEGEELLDLGERVLRAVCFAQGAREVAEGNRIAELGGDGAAELRDGLGGAAGLMEGGGDDVAGGDAGRERRPGSGAPGARWQRGHARRRRGRLG